jgi:hypothetical protein
VAQATPTNDVGRDAPPGAGQMEEASPEPLAPIFRAKAALLSLHERLQKLM